MPAVHVLPWPDPVIDTLGHDPRSLYVELFLLPTLGPTTLLLARHLAQRFDREPDGFTLDLMETSLALGLGPREGANSPVARALARLAQFDLARATRATAAVAEAGPGADADSGDEVEPEAAAVWQVRQAFPPVNRRHLKRLPPSLQAALSSWTAVHLVDAARQRARRVAFVLLETGEAPDLVERALLRAGFSPTLCHEATDWATARHAEARAALGDRTDGAVGGAPVPPVHHTLGRTEGGHTLGRTEGGRAEGGLAAVAGGPAVRPAGERRPGIAPRVPPPPRRSPVGR
jgi:hypothetical protein